jgi:4-hydroxybenzoate polyprenyltransferase
LKAINISAYARLLRIRQYYKNLLVLAPLIFAGVLIVPEQFTNAFLAFIAFCLLSSLFYIFNDIRDIEKDRNHPVKKMRPLVTGEIRRNSALIVSVFLIILLIPIFFLLPLNFFFVAISYGVLTILYTLFLKQFVIIDVFTLGVGFILRVLAGSVALGVELSAWLFIAAFLLALVLGFSKRISEIKLCSDSIAHKKTLGSYDLSILRSYVIISTSSVVIVYLIYAILVVSDPIFIITSIFVLYGVFRFLSLAMKDGLDPDTMFEDKPFMVNIILWIVAFVVTLYVR